MQKLPSVVACVLSSRPARLFFAIIFVCALFLTPSAITSTTTDAADVPRVSLDTVLTADGSLDLSRSWNGSIDAQGWSMTTASDGSPRFVRGDSGARTTSPRTTVAAVPGDEKWDDRSDYQVPTTRSARSRSMKATYTLVAHSRRLVVLQQATSPSGTGALGPRSDVAPAAPSTPSP